MNELRDLVLLVVSMFAVVSGLLYVLAVIDPQTERGDATIGHPGDTGLGRPT